MLFNSLDFAIFLPIVFSLFWIAKKNLKLQNFILLLSSYIFYGWWDWRFLILIFVSTIVDFNIAKLISKQDNKKQKKRLLFLSLFLNLGLLGFFKYFNFFIDSFLYSFSVLGYELGNKTSLNIILPVGISFYTFQTLSYTIDTYRAKIKPSNDFIAFAAYVCFFPQLVAGPIEKATTFLPQFSLKKTFDKDLAINGLRQILWGLFKKVVIADNCAKYANIIFEGSSEFNGSTLLLGGVFFALQIYGDFSGYSDIAIGVSRLFGFNLMKNFSYPYFSRDMAEFWRRWHISLSNWFKDYVYIPLGGSKGNTFLKIRNTFTIFLISGFWHGAKWTFIFWGLMNAIYFLPILLTNNNRNNIDIISKGRIFPSFIDLLMVIKTFLLAVLMWIMFRANNLQHAWEYYKTIFSKSTFSVPNLSFVEEPLAISFLIAFFFMVEWFGREHEFGIEETGKKWNKFFRHSFYYIIIIFIFLFGGNEQEFIYFQF